MKHIKGLDTLRAFAVFFVLIQHTGFWFDTTVPNGRFISTVIIPDGGFGVFLFFVLSGFLITSILLNARQESSNTDRITIFKNFFVRRILRIFPIYYLVVLLLYAVNYPGVRDHIWYHFTYTTNILCYNTNSWSNLGHTWTLCVEEQFYLLWPWLILFVQEKYLRYIFFAAIIIGISSTYYNMAETGHIGPLLVCNCFDAFGIGGLYAYAKRNNSQNRNFEKMITIAGCISLVIYFYWKICAFSGMPQIKGLFLTKTVNSILSIWLIIAVIKNKSEPIKRYLLENRFLNFIGKISYGIYLYHGIYLNWCYGPVNDFIDRSTKQFVALNKLVTDRHYYYWIHIAVIILISTISYYFIEKPFLNLKRFFNYKKPTIPPPAAIPSP